jgi:homogentisate 1,2-dioxygenase
MQANGVYVMNVLPKPAEGVAGTERTQWYHRNVNYDEIAFFHGGSLYGIPMPPGLISLYSKVFIMARQRRLANATAASSTTTPASTGR